MLTTIVKHFPCPKKLSVHNNGMQLFYSPASPFARKVLVAAREAGVIDDIEIISTTVSPTSRNDAIAIANPIGKIPTMVLNDGRTIFDSRVICEYVDGLSPSIKLFPNNSHSRLTAETLHALGDGMMDAALLARYETSFRPQEYRWKDWENGQKDKLFRSLDYLEQQCIEILNGPVSIGHVAIGCALSYIDFREVLEDWRIGHDNLNEWYSRFSQRDSMKATEPS